MLVRVLVVAGPGHLRNRFRKLLSSGDVLCETVANTESMWTRLSRGDFDLVVTSATVLTRPPGATVRGVRALPDAPDVIVLVGSDNAEERAALLAAGAMGVVQEDLPEEALTEALQALVGRRRQTAQPPIDGGRGLSRANFADFASASSAMQEFLDLARRVARARTSVLILGETGVGKEWLARAIHRESGRAEEPFVAVNCAALPEGILESELFGHVEGAFTGAVRARRGHFELAHRGSLFLDEIGDLPLSLQPKLLRALQERRISPVGGEKEIAVDVRIIAASNQDLEEAIRAKRFRSDLYYRLGVITLTMPPLRERPEDIPLLADSYVRQFSAEFGSSVADIDPNALAVLQEYGWPGNVRELINVLERSVLLCEGPTLTRNDLRRSMLLPSAGGTAPNPRLSPDLVSDYMERPLSEGRDALVEQFERVYLTRLLRETNGRIGVAATQAGISTRTLYGKMQAYGLSKEMFRT